MAETFEVEYQPDNRVMFAQGVSVEKLVVAWVQNISRLPAKGSGS